MKAQKIVIWILSGTIMLLVAFYLFERNRFYNLFWEMRSEYGRLSSLRGVRQGEDLVYYGLSKDSVMKMLPVPEFDFVTKLDSSMVNVPGYRFFSQFLKSRYDTIEVNVAKWRIPYHEIPNLFLQFMKRDGVWVVVDGVQWNDDTQIHWWE